MGRLSREKGAAWERECAARLRAIGVKAERNLTETREGNSGDVWTDLPLAIQCKVGARPDIYGAVKEADAVASPKHDFAVAVIKRNGSRHKPADELAVMPLDHFLEIINLLKGTGVW